ncbi:TolC family protein [Rhodocytophaga rosea]|uniref:TolC family protein n=1 Tax=Rhodocytophaga rosea TaxID=2704465 RepID=A0A6C0GLI9_9BACT|nr:TolC family protein [Rhodocytophaga rosea]QHT68492.1 TolC family protein [Rhodocytophaga rosea]
MKSQKAPVIIEQTQESFDLKIPPLDTLIAYALRTSPTLKMQESLMRKNSYLIKSEKSRWADAIATDITAGFGNQSLLVQQPTGDITNFNNFNNGYRVGATLRISMYDLFGRKNEVGMAVSEYEESRHKKDMLAKEIVSEVTSLYYILIASKNIMQIKSEAKHATALNRNMAEKEFNEANIHVAELSRIIEISSKAATEYEIAKQELYKNIRIMENIVGVKLF